MPKIIITTFENNETTALPEIPPALETTMPLETTVPSEKETDNQTIPEKVLYLTFDDGPSIRYTMEILDILKEKDHDIVGSTAECLEDLIEQFQDYQIEPLTPEVKPVQFREKTS